MNDVRNSLSFKRKKIKLSDRSRLDLFQKDYVRIQSALREYGYDATLAQCRELHLLVSEENDVYWAADASDEKIFSFVWHWFEESK